MASIKKIPLHRYFSSKSETKYYIYVDRWEEREVWKSEKRPTARFNQRFLYACIILVMGAECSKAKILEIFNDTFQCFDDCFVQQNLYRKPKKNAI